MRGAVAAARYGDVAPPELKLAWWCGSTRLPDAGGVLDQDAETWTRINTLGNVYRIASKLNNLRGEDIHRLTDAERVIWRYLVDEGLWHG